LEFEVVGPDIVEDPVEEQVKGEPVRVTGGDGWIWVV
jgi:hypothetical protein